MSSFRQLTRSQQSFHSRQSDSDSSGRVRSPSLEPKAWTSRVPVPTPILRPSEIVDQTPDLFATLIHNRERAYYHMNKRPASPEHENKMAAPKVANKRVGPAKKETTKSKGTVKESKVTKKPATRKKSVQGQGRAPKTTRTQSKANIGKKVDISSDVMATKSPFPEIIELSDSEVDAEQASLNMLSRLRARQPWSQTQDVHPKIDEEAPTLLRPFNSISDGPNVAQELQKANEELQRAHVELHKSDEELHKLHEELQAERSTVHNLRQEIEKGAASTLLEKQQASDILTQKLEAERQKCRDQSQSYQAVLAQQATLETEHAALKVQLEQEQTTRKEEQERHSNVLQESIQSTAAELTHTHSQLQTLQSENTQLLTDNELLKAKISTLSPVPSLSPLSSHTDEDIKETNVRKMYVKTKRQYDVLRAAATDLARCTRTWDLTCAGEIGVGVKKLRKALDDEGGTVHTVGARKEEGEG
jgi:hypothetical protein